MDTKMTYPKGEIVWVAHYDAKHNLKYITTSKLSRDTYYLYKAENGKFVKVGKAADPKTLEEKYISHQTERSRAGKKQD